MLLLSYSRGSLFHGRDREEFQLGLESDNRQRICKKGPKCVLRDGKGWDSTIYVPSSILFSTPAHPLHRDRLPNLIRIKLFLD